MSYLGRVGALMFAMLPSLALASDYKILHVGEILAVPGESTQKQQSIVIKDNKIERIERGYISKDTVDEKAKIIDLRDKFVLPGLMDMHVHIQYQLGPQSKQQAVTLSAEDVAMRSVHFAEKTLQAGFTLVRDLGADPQALYALRDATAKQWVTGPRIVAAGRVPVTGGHADVDGMRHDLLEKYTSDTVCNGPYECRAATRKAIKYGADLIKITSTGGVLSDTDTGTGVQMADDELDEIVKTAHALGRKVASHAHAVEGINAALQAGVDSIEHGSYADETSIALFNSSGAYLVPTLLAGHTVVQMAKNSSFMSPAIKAKAIRVGGDMMANFTRAYRAGVNIAFGTDSGVSSHGNNAYEAVLMQQAGMTPMDIIISATINAADLVDMSDSLGTLEPGKLADIIAVDDNPLDDISALQDVSFVMKGGQTYKQQ